MAALHEALTTLQPVHWNDVPHDNLLEYMQNAFTAGELINNSIPPQPSGEPFHTARPHHRHPNSAKSSKEMHPSSARSHPPCAEHEELHKAWGKPMKIGKEKNPHEVSLYKMAGHDRHGAWFARRSVHEGLGFDRFRRAMQREFPQSLSVQGGPGAGAVRGLAADRRVEQKRLDPVGEMEVYQLSSAFPGPVTPRDFVPLILTTEDSLSEKSGHEVEGGEKHVPRNYMIVSIPCTHPNAPERGGFVRGQYESVELIREIPLHRRRKTAQSTPNLLDSHAEEHHGRERGHTVGVAESRGLDAKGEQRDLSHSTPALSSTEDEGENDPELNPVEWIMVTRSDPGGGIPRFLVERGTPDAMIGDVSKFLNWATSLGDIPEKDEDLDKQVVASEINTETQRRESGVPAALPNGDASHTSAAAPVEPVQRASSAPVSADQQQQGGMFSSMAHTIEHGLQAYAPTAVSTQLHNYLHPTHASIGAAGDDLDESDTSETSSDAGSFMSAAEMRRLSTAEGRSDLPADSAENLSIMSQGSSSEMALGGDGKSKSSTKLNQHEKEVQKLIRDREKLDRKLAKKRAEEESKLKKSQEKESGEQDKAKERHEKEVRKAEDRHRKELEKLEHKKAKEARKAEESRRKKDERNKLSLVSRERDEFRGQLDSYKRENSLLLERVEELQRENTVMANKLGKLGPEVLKGVQEEVEGLRKRAASTRSQGSESKKSLESAGSKGS